MWHLTGRYKLKTLANKIIMKEVFEDIVKKTNECEEKQDMFSLPHIENYEIFETENQSGGATLLSRTWVIGDEKENIKVDYESKDKCRTFQVNPDRNIVKISWNKDGEIIDSHNTAWDDKM